MWWEKYDIIILLTLKKGVSMSKYDNKKNYETERHIDLMIFLVALMALGFILYKKDAFTDKNIKKIEYVNKDGELSGVKMGVMDSFVQVRNKYDSLIMVENSKMPVNDSVLNKLVTERFQVVSNMNKHKRLK